MSRVQTKKQLLKEISLLIDEYVHFTLHKKPDYNFVVNENDEDEENQNNVQEVQEVEEVQEVPQTQQEDYDPTRCLGVKTNKDQCTRKRMEDGDDPELCKFHNNPKYIGRIQKVEVPSQSVEKVENSESEDRSDNENPEPNTEPTSKPETGSSHPNNANNANNANDANTTSKNDESSDSSDESAGESSDESSGDDVEQVYIKKDEDGDAVDQMGNIWNMDTKVIIGKKDLQTGQKVLFKKV